MRNKRRITDASNLFEIQIDLVQLSAARVAGELFLSCRRRYGSLSRGRVVVTEKVSAARRRHLWFGFHMRWRSVLGSPDGSVPVVCLEPICRKDFGSRGSRVDSLQCFVFSSS